MVVDWSFKTKKNNNIAPIPKWPQLLRGIQPQKKTLMQKFCWMSFCTILELFLVKHPNKLVFHRPKKNFSTTQPFEFLCFLHLPHPPTLLSHPNNVPEVPLSTPVAVESHPRHHLKVQDRNPSPLRIHLFATGNVQRQPTNGYVQSSNPWADFFQVKIYHGLLYSFNDA